MIHKIFIVLISLKHFIGSPVSYSVNSNSIPSNKPSISLPSLVHTRKRKWLIWFHHYSFNISISYTYTPVLVFLISSMLLKIKFTMAKNWFNLMTLFLRLSNNEIGFYGIVEQLASDAATGMVLVVVVGSLWRILCLLKIIKNTLIERDFIIL